MAYLEQLCTATAYCYARPNNYPVHYFASCANRNRAPHNASYRYITDRAHRRAMGRNGQSGLQSFLRCLPRWCIRRRALGT